MSFAALLGQPRAAAQLGSALANGRVHHAYLFAGPPGVGKTFAAKLLAQALNCEGPAALEAAKAGRFPPDACGTCASCKRISDDPKKNAHPLVLWLDTEQAMEATGLYSANGERTPAKAIGVRLIRDLVIPRMALKVMGGRRKVCILRDVEFTDGAQNAFLKTLEEPPGDTTFIVLSSSPDELKVTIRSRCQRVPFQPLPRELIAERVEKERKLGLPEATLLAALADGNLGRALETSTKMLTQRRELIISLNRVASDDWVGWLDLAERLGEKDTAIESIGILETWLHDIARTAAGHAPSTNLDLAAEATEMAAKLGLPEVLRRVEVLRRAKFGIEANGQPRLQLERAFLAFGGITPLAMATEA